jgi:hypothetical protein
VESLRAARHFKLGAAAYASEGYSPWKHPITGPWFHDGDDHSPTQPEDPAKWTST